mmetsp:Transcript_4961/g.17244  ORF Transcript_4961/g.17244 Transcript_4961/m.17244 type:complete len:251 (-) Transcript_4961:2547-3299(-)
MGLHSSSRREARRDSGARGSKAPPRASAVHAQSVARLPRRAAHRSARRGARSAAPLPLAHAIGACRMGQSRARDATPERRERSARLQAPQPHHRELLRRVAPGNRAAAPRREDAAGGARPHRERRVQALALPRTPAGACETAHAGGARAGAPVTAARVARVRAGGVGGTHAGCKGAAQDRARAAPDVVARVGRRRGAPEAGGERARGGAAARGAPRRRSPRSELLQVGRGGGLQPPRVHAADAARQARRG